jgi:hypothetical protein
MPSLSSLVGVSAGLASLAAGQYFPPSPEDFRVIHSKHKEGVTISYKEVCLELKFFRDNITPEWTGHRFRPCSNF